MRKSLPLQLICLSLLTTQTHVYSYGGTNRIDRSIDCSINDLDCVPESRAAVDRTQELIDCEIPDNCQTNTLNSNKAQPKPKQRQPPNNCQNSIDCQDSNVQYRPHRRTHRHHHRHSHRYNEQRSPEMVSMTALQTWNCDFGTNDCGIHNQYNMGSYFVPVPDSADPVLGRRGLLYLDLSRAHSAGARLVTPYFPTNGCRYACLTIEYILCGNSIENLYLIQQDVRNYCVWQKRNDHEYRWTTTSMTIDLSKSNPRFFLEVRFDPRVNNFGFVGIADMKFKYGECEHNEANECDLNRFVGTLL